MTESSSQNGITVIKLASSSRCQAWFKKPVLKKAQCGCVFLGFIGFFKFYIELVLERQPRHVWIHERCNGMRRQFYTNVTVQCMVCSVMILAVDEK